MNVKSARTILLATLLAGAAVHAQIARPTTLWFNKVISTERSRQLYIALHSSMWVNYDLPFGVLTQAWQGGTTGGAFISGNVYSATGSASGQYWFYNGSPQFPHVYRSSGTKYFRDSNQVAEFFASYTNPAHINTSVYYTSGKWPVRPISTAWPNGTYKSWTALNASSQEINAKFVFRGYTVSTNNVLTLKYGLVLPDNSEIAITEYPEYSNQPSGNRLVRTFTFSNIPAGHEVRLHRLGGSTPSVWSVTSGSATIQSGILVQTANGQTVVNGSF